MDVILHVGAHRTATTTFQHHMASYRCELAAHGAVDWGSKAARGGFLPRTRIRERLVTWPRRWRHVMEEFARALPDATLMVWTFGTLSQQPFRVLEGLCGLPTPEAKVAHKNASPTAGVLRRRMAGYDIDSDESTWRDGHSMPFAPHEVAAFDAQYDEYFTWLANGAAGPADYIAAPSAQSGELTDDGRGTPDDGENRCLA